MASIEPAALRPNDRLTPSREDGAPTSPPGSDPHATYAARRGERARLRAERERGLEVIANARLAVFVGGLVLAYFVFGAAHWSPLWLVGVGLAFIALVVWSERIKRSAKRAERAVAYYERGLARLEDRWHGIGESGERFLDPDHPFAADLDLFGKGSLFQRLNCASTRNGEETLARWLLADANLEVARERQAAIAEMRDRLDLREALATGGADVRDEIETEALAAWGTMPPILTNRATPWVSALISGIAAATLVLWLADRLPASVFFAAVLLVVAFDRIHRPKIAQVLGDVERRATDLARLAELLEVLEGHEFRSPALVKLRARLDREGVAPSRRIRGLTRLVTLLDAMRNQFSAPFLYLLGWPIQMAWRIDSWRVAHGHEVAGWMGVVGEFEAYASLAAFAFENPENPFPELVPEGPRFEAVGLGHPLLSASKVIRNDVALGGELRVLVVSGSNMSGKSTLLRSIGISTILAWMGSTVRAGSLTISPLAVGGTLRVQDSLQAGKSRFYAEITRVRQIVDISRGPIPLLFLLDEIFSGTNSHERCHGAEAIVRGLIRSGAIGLVTTHDLTLAEIGDKLAPQARNVHFEDQFEDGHLSFDYQMRPGIVTKSNALALMRAVGLEV